MKNFWLFSVFFQLVAIPFLYYSLYLLASIFHTPKPIDEEHGMSFYLFTEIFIAFVVVLGVLLTGLAQLVLKKEIYVIPIHLLWIVFIVWFTFGDLEYMPYDHGLVLFCISLSIPVRLILKSKYGGEVKIK